MLENTLQSNRELFYKFATITVRVFVDKDEVENEMLRKPVMLDEAFETIAKEKINDMFKSDDPCKLYDISFS